MNWLIWSGVLLLIAVLYVVFVFNSLVRLRNRSREAFSGIDVQLKRRHDLIPNLVRVVSGYAKHEKGVLEEIARVRSEAMSASSTGQRENSENALRQSLDQLFVLVERYPDLKADQNFRQLQSQLVEIEDQLQYARRYYNGTVRDLNTRVEQFPTNVFAAMFQFHPENFFQLESPTERNNVSVSMGEA